MKKKLVKKEKHVGGWGGEGGGLEASDVQISQSYIVLNVFTISQVCNKNLKQNSQ